MQSGIITNISMAADIPTRFAAPAFPPKAYEILGGMEGKLEKPLLAAFRDVALNR